METQYMDMPTNFIKQKEKKFRPTTQQVNSKFHHISVPIMQFTKFEKTKHIQQAQKQLEADKLLQTKLKVLSNMNLTFFHNQVSPYASDPLTKIRKSLPVIPPTKSKLESSQMKEKTSGSPLKSQSIVEPQPDKNKNMKDAKPRLRNLEDDQQGSPSRIPQYIPTKPRLVNTLSDEKLGKSSSHKNIRALTMDLDDEGFRSHAKILQETLSFQKSVPAIPSMLGKTFSFSREPTSRRGNESPEINFSPDTSLQQQRLYSPKKRQIHKNSMLNLLREPSPVFQEGSPPTLAHIESCPPMMKEGSKPDMLFPRSTSLVRLFPIQEGDKKQTRDGMNTQLKIRDKEEVNKLIKKSTVLFEAKSNSIKQPENLSPDALKGKLAKKKSELHLMKVIFI